MNNNLCLVKITFINQVARDSDANKEGLYRHPDYAMDKKLYPYKQWGVITHPCPNGSLDKHPLKLHHEWMITCNMKKGCNHLCMSKYQLSFVSKRNPWMLWIRCREFTCPKSATEDILKDLSNRGVK